MLCDLAHSVDMCDAPVQDYSRSPCLALGLGVCTRPSLPACDPVQTARDPHDYVPALNDALSITAFSELDVIFIPLYGSSTVIPPLTST